MAVNVVRGRDGDHAEEFTASDHDGRRGGGPAARSLSVRTLMVSSWGTELPLLPRWPAGCGHRFGGAAGVTVQIHDLTCRSGTFIMDDGGT